MGVSVPGIINSNMYGIPFTGVDICGFIGDTTPELCARWTTIGALYPFSRNHNLFGSVDQEPYQPLFKARYEEGVTFEDIIRNGIRRKYSVMRYMYAELTRVSMDGGQVYKPVFYEFPEDVNTWNSP